MSEVQVACPGCNAVFAVPVEFCGEMAECAECTMVFEIPKGEVAQTTDTGTIKGVKAADFNEETTNTVKLSRTGIGMIPTLKESFDFGTKEAALPGKTPAMPQKPSIPKPSMPKPQMPAATPTRISVPKTPTMNDLADTSTENPAMSASQTAMPKAIDIPAWTNIIISKNERPVGFKELTGNIPMNAFLISIPPLVSIIAVVLAKVNIAAGLIAGVLIWGAAFGVAFAMLKSTAKKGLLLTNNRAVYTNGKERLEIKK